MEANGWKNESSDAVESYGKNKLNRQGDVIRVRVAAGPMNLGLWSIIAHKRTEGGSFEGIGVEVVSNHQSAENAMADADARWRDV